MRNPRSLSRGFVGHHYPCIIPSRLHHLNPFHLNACRFEVFEVIRRLFLSGILVLFEPGSTVQMGVAILICFLSITVYSIYSPLKTGADNQLQWLTQFQVRCHATVVKRSEQKTKMEILC